MATKTSKKQQNRIRIKLKSYDAANLDSSTKQIVEAAERTGARIAGPIPLPSNIRRYCVLRSPHVDKKSREHFQIKTHSRLIDLLDPTHETTVALKDLDLPAGVDISVKVQIKPSSSQLITVAILFLSCALTVLDGISQATEKGYNKTPTTPSPGAPV